MTSHLHTPRVDQASVAAVEPVPTHQQPRLRRPTLTPVAVPGLLRDGMPSGRIDLGDPVAAGGRADVGGRGGAARPGGPRCSLEVLRRRSPGSTPAATPTRRDILLPLRRGGSERAIRGGSTILRTIAVGDTVYPDARAALAALQTSFPGVDPTLLTSVLGVLNANNVRYLTVATLVSDVAEAMKWLANHDPRTADKESWVILHRFKADSFKDYLLAQHGTDSAAGSTRKDYETTSARYAPEKFGKKTGIHSWHGNYEWLLEVINNTKVTKVLLTAVPLTDANIFRTDRVGQKFSAYAREIAGLLLAGYIPLWAGTLDRHRAVKSLDTVVMAKSETLPPGLVTVLARASSRVDIGTAKHILSSTVGEKTDKTGYEVSTGRTTVGVTEAKLFFRAAGLPVIGIDEAPAPVVHRTGSTEAVKIAYLIRMASYLTLEERKKFFISDKVILKRIKARKDYVEVFGDTGWTALRKFNNVHRWAIEKSPDLPPEQQPEPEGMGLSSSPTPDVFVASILDQPLVATFLNAKGLRVEPVPGNRNSCLFESVFYLLFRSIDHAIIRDIRAQLHSAGCGTLEEMVEFKSDEWEQFAMYLAKALGVNATVTVYAGQYGFEPVTTDIGNGNRGRPFEILHFGAHFSPLVPSNAAGGDQTANKPKGLLRD